jgi:ABC-type Fe3+/spermidine/putrescine transport system ATPase subunit
VAGFLGAMNWFGDAGVRPESTRLSREAPNSGPSRICVVESSLFLGNCIHVNTILEGGGRAIAEVPRGQDHFQEGETVWLSWLPDDERVFARESSAGGSA